MRFVRWETLVFGVLSSVLLFVTTVGTHLTSSRRDVVTYGMGAILITASGIIFIRFSRLGLYVRDDEVVVRNVLITRRLELASIDGIAVREVGLKRALVHVRDGRAVGVTALDPRNQAFRPRNRSAQRLCSEAMDAIRARMMTDPGSRRPTESPPSSAMELAPLPMQADRHCSPSWRTAQSSLVSRSVVLRRFDA